MNGESAFVSSDSGKVYFKGDLSMIEEEVNGQYREIISKISAIEDVYFVLAKNVLKENAAKKMENDQTAIVLNLVKKVNEGISTSEEEMVLIRYLNDFNDLLLSLIDQAKAERIKFMIDKKM